MVVLTLCDGALSCVCIGWHPVVLSSLSREGVAWLTRAILGRKGRKGKREGRKVVWVGGREGNEARGEGVRGRGGSLQSKTRH